MKIAFITPSVSRSAGGIFEIELALARSLHDKGHIIKVYGQLDENTVNDLPRWEPMNINVFTSIGPHSFRFSPSLQKAVLNSNCDVAHLHVIWMYTSLVINKWHKTGRPYIVTINGMLEPWALKNANWKKQVAKFLYEDRCLTNAACIHANTYKEYIDIRKFGLKKPVCIIPNGVDLPGNNISIKTPAWFHKVNNRKVLLYLGRLHPKKGLDNLILAWAQIANQTKHWCLVIAGWGEKEYVQRLESKSEELKQEENIIYAGAQFGQEKNNTFAHADAFILPSFSEGLPMAILEAWSYKLPVLSTVACNIPEGYNEHAAIEIDSSPSGIVKGLNQLFCFSHEERIQMGKNGFDLINKKFTWDKVANQMTAVYKWVLQGGKIPETIILN
jgi:poly(glycerol-phosphate) alpha-glucosyltransferase